jgi:hypothetical protein
VRCGIGNVLELFILLELLPIQHLQSAVELYKVDTTTDHYFVLGALTKELINLFELFDYKSTAFNMIVPFAIDHQNLFLFLQERLTLIIAPL